MLKYKPLLLINLYELDCFFGLIVQTAKSDTYFFSSWTSLTIVFSKKEKFDTFSGNNRHF